MKKLTFNKVMNNMIALEAVIDDTLFARRDEDKTGRNVAIGAGVGAAGLGGLAYAGRDSADAYYKGVRGAQYGERAGKRLGSAKYGEVVGRRLGQGVGAIQGGAKRALAGASGLPGAVREAAESGYGAASRYAKSAKKTVKKQYGKLAKRVSKFFK